MKYLVLSVLVAVCMVFAPPQETEAQTLELAAIVTSPQAGEVGLEGRTFGYGFAATYAFTAIHDVIHPVGTIQYHVHNTATVNVGELGFINGADKDFFAGAGARVNIGTLYAQGIGGFVQKRDALVDAENDTKLAGSVGFGVQPGLIGVGAAWYFSDFGTQYSAGINLRF